jgi:hypothetical protein
MILLVGHKKHFHKQWERIMKLAHLVAVDKYSCSMGNTIFFYSIHALEGNLSSPFNETGTGNANFSTYPNQITQMAVSSVRSEGKRLYNITIYRKLFPPQLVSPDLEPLKKNPTLCQKIYYCHPLACSGTSRDKFYITRVQQRPLV